MSEAVLQRDLRRDARAALRHLAVRKDAHSAVLADDGERGGTFQQKERACAGDGAFLKGKGERDLKEALRAFQIEQNAPLHAQREERPRDPLLPYDAQARIGAHEILDMNARRAAEKVQFHALGRGKQKVLVKAEADGRVCGRFELAEYPVRRVDLHRSLEAVHRAQIHSVYKERARLFGAKKYPHFISLSLLFNVCSGKIMSIICVR